MLVVPLGGTIVGIIGWGGSGIKTVNERGEVGGLVLLPSRGL